MYFYDFPIIRNENRLPVYFEAPLRVGVAAGRMSGYGGLKSPFTSLVKK